MRSDDRTLGQLGYETYGEEAGWVSYGGEPMSAWTLLPEDVQNRWEVMTKAVAMEALKRSSRPTGMHRRVQTG
jgi:hypothetical protein